LRRPWVVVRGLGRPFEDRVSTTSSVDLLGSFDVRLRALASVRDVWFLVEGMADYVQRQRPGVDGYRKRYALADLLRQRPLRSVSVKPSADDADLRDADGRYAVGFYAVSFLFERYGKAKTLQFFQGAVQHGIGLDGASQTAFGTWDGSSAPVYPPKTPTWGSQSVTGDDHWRAAFVQLIASA
jgi:hypothetical protein